MLLRSLVLSCCCVGFLYSGNDPFTASDEMKAYFHKVTLNHQQPKAKLQALIDAFLVKPADQGGLGLQYDNEYTRTVEEVWRDKKANCLSLTAFYVAAARHIGIDTSYAEALNTQHWRKVGNVVHSERHVVALARLSVTDDLVADFLPQLRKRWGTYTVTVLPENRFRALFYSNRAVELLEKSDNAGAMAQAETSIKADPTCSVGWNTRGVVQRALDDTAQAEASYRQALKLDPKDSAAVGNLEGLMRDLGREKEAAKFREMGLSIRKKDPYFHAFLAEEALAEGNVEEARNRTAQALKLQPYEPEFHLLNARLKMLDGHLDDAIKAIEEARKWSRPDQRQRFDNKLSILKGEEPEDVKEKK